MTTEEKVVLGALAVFVVVQMTKPKEASSGPSNPLEGLMRMGGDAVHGIDGVLGSVAGFGQTVLNGLGLGGDDGESPLTPPPPDQQWGESDTPQMMGE